MNPLSKTKIKYIKSLQLKKYRLQEDKFIVEGEKSVLEFLRSDYTVSEVVGTKYFFENNQDISLSVARWLASEKELAGIGTFKSNNSVLAVVAIQPETPFTAKEAKGVILALDQINDPGNLGTIIRIADWFGIEHLVLSPNSVDVYNPKVVNASKGSLTRVNIHYRELKAFLDAYPGNIYAAMLEGTAIGQVAPVKNGIILMGSESHGIADDLTPYIGKKITIPRRGLAESLNVAVATGIICHQLVEQ